MDISGDRIVTEWSELYAGMYTGYKYVYRALKDAINKYNADSDRTIKEDYYRLQDDLQEIIRIAKDLKTMQEIKHGFDLVESRGWLIIEDIPAKVTIKYTDGGTE